ncbi:MAG: aldehyde-activating protein, partial [Proteobacteria bacterium]
MSMSYQGGCACGAIRYEISAEPLASVDCYCRDCQKESG